MKNILKVALGFVAGGTLIYLSQRRKKSKSDSQNYTAPDGNSYKPNQMYRNAQGEIFKNGKQLHFETPQLLNNANARIDLRLARNIQVKDIINNNQNVLYHKRGVRHH